MAGCKILIHNFRQHKKLFFSSDKETALQLQVLISDVVLHRLLSSLI